MTLPKGFGQGGSNGERCPNCKRFTLVWDTFLDKKRCTNKECRLNKKDIVIPLKKSEFGMNIFYITHYGGIIGIIYGIVFPNALPIILGFFGVFISTLGGLLATDSWRNKDWNWSMRRRMFPWAVPISNYIKRMRFVSDD